MNSILIIKERNEYCNPTVFGHVAWVSAVEHVYDNYFIHTLESEMFPNLNDTNSGRFFGCWYKKTVYPYCLLDDPLFLYLEEA